jgi:Barstar (barnase inhibitor)
VTDDALLDGPPDIHRWPDLQWARTYADQVAAQGWRVVDLDTSVRWDKRGFLAACRTTFGFPDWFGMNWDALADSLTDVDVPSDAGLLVAWRGWGPMARMFPTDYAVATDVLAEWVTRSQARSATVLVSLVGSGPGSSVTEL